MWCLITPLNTGPSPPASRYGFPSSELCVVPNLTGVPSESFPVISPFFWQKCLNPRPDSKNNVPDCTSIVWRGSLLKKFILCFLSCWPDSFIWDIQRWLLSTFRPGNERPKKKKIFFQAATWKIFFFYVVIDYIVFFLFFFYMVINFHNSLPFARWPSEHKGECLYEVYSCVTCHFLRQCLQRVSILHR